MHICLHWRWVVALVRRRPSPRTAHSRACGWLWHSSPCLPLALALLRSLAQSRPPPAELVGVPSRALKALAALPNAMENADLTLGFTSDPEGKFQVQSTGLTFVSRLIRDGCFALQAANCP